MPHKTGLFLFNNDLRLHDNEALTLAAAQVDQLICVYCAQTTQSSATLQAPSSLSPHRQVFLAQALSDLQTSLKKLGQHLVVTTKSALEVIPQLITVHNIDHIYSSVSPGYYEQKNWQTLAKRYPFIGFHRLDTHTLFHRAQLPFAVEKIPDGFSKFRKHVESLSINLPLAAPKQLPPSPVSASTWKNLPYSLVQAPLFEGGEEQALAHLEGYFSTRLASDYKLTRNGLDGMDYSTKFSPWLANGNLSARQVIHCLKLYEQEQGANDSTYWIYFELLWREYYQWYGHCHGKKLFRVSGIKTVKPKTSFYAERFQKWCSGNTPYPIVNACMKQLNSTGYMSNRGRQLVASCFVHELGLDWRYGAAYMEEHLVDYDVASNWGNWQYLAGVGADPRGHRRFDLNKQTLTYDPHQVFIKQWAGHQFDTHLDSVDAADWPISR